MKILCVPTGPLSVNTYIVFNESAETLSNSEKIRLKNQNKRFHHNLKKLLSYALEA